MKRFLKQFLLILFILFFSNVVFSQTELKGCKNYFDGLQFLKEKNYKKAAAAFSRGLSEKNKISAVLSGKALANIEDPKIKQTGPYAFYQAFPTNTDAILSICENFYSIKSYTKIIDICNKAEEQKVLLTDDIMYIRLNALLQANDKSFSKVFSNWYTRSSITTLHQTFYEEINSYPTSTQVNNLLDLKTKALCEVRLSYFKRDYTKANENLAKYYAFQNLPQEEILYKLPRNVLSDIGRIYLFSQNNKKMAADLFNKTANLCKKSTLPNAKHNQFLALIYRARILLRCGKQEAQTAETAFLQAIEAAPLPENYDNAVWLYIDSFSDNNLQAKLNIISKYAPTWHDSEYFEDILDELSVTLLSQKYWTRYYDFFKQIEPYCNSSTLAKYSYISARLIEENLVTIPKAQKDTLVKKYLTTAYYGNHTDIYYRILAAERLEIPIEDVSKSMMQKTKATDFVKNEQVEQILRAYVDYDYPELIYPLFIKYVDEVTIDTALYVSKKLSIAGQDDPILLSESLRTISNAVASVDSELSLEIFKQLYPRYFTRYVTQSCNTYKLDEWLIYALIRTESFFNKDVVSHAGAIGLAQLMKPTAGDIAKALKIKNYDLLDAKTNITFGTYYLANMQSRLNDSPMLALFAYNGGVTRVRRWLKASSFLPMDLFLETVPINETRNYGRKVLSAAAMYGYLYYNKSPHEIINSIMK